PGSPLSKTVKKAASNSSLKTGSVVFRMEPPKLARFPSILRHEMSNCALYFGSKDGLWRIAVPETVPSEFILALKENCLLTVLPAVFWSKTVPWPEADGLRAAADVDRSTKVVAAMVVINNPAKRNFLLRLIFVSLICIVLV